MYDNLKTQAEPCLWLFGRRGQLLWKEDCCGAIRNPRASNKANHCGY